jgi:drug/metabolite transporter (DMT)-like permease
MNVSRTRVIVAFAAIYFVWGSTFYGVLLALKSFPVFLLSALRLLIAGSALSLYCAFREEKLPSAQVITRNMVCGLVIFIGGIVAVVWAQQYISSSLASIIITTPFWFVVLDRRQWAFYFSNGWIVGGLILGLVGVILLLGFRENNSADINSSMQAVSILVMIAGSFMWVAGSLYLKYNPTGASVYTATTIQLLTAGLFCLAISFLYGEVRNFSVANVRTDSVIALLYLSIASSLLTFMAFVWLIKVRPPAIVSTYSYVNPLVAVLLGWTFADERISLIQLASLFLILLGVFFVNVPKYKISTS